MNAALSVKKISSGLRARALTEFYHFHAACLVADNTRKTDVTLTLGGCHFVYTRFHGIIMHGRDYQLSHLRYMVQFSTA